MEFPKEIPVMPLPNAILFPRVLLPLSIFEARYRRMLADCLAGDRMFAVALMRQGWHQAGRQPPPYPVAGLGLIRTCIGQADGTAHLILQGLTRVRIRRYVHLRPYRIAEIEPLTSQTPAEPPDQQLLTAVVSRLARARARLGMKMPQSVLKYLRSIQSPDHLADLVSFLLLDDDHEKQLMLEMLDVEKRLDRLVGLLEKQIEQFQFWKSLQGKLPNKDVGIN